jgi:hypothetical protein
MGFQSYALLKIVKTHVGKNRKSHEPLQRENTGLSVSVLPTKKAKQIISHLLALRRNVSRRLYNPFTPIVMLIKLRPESLEHWDVRRVALKLLLALACITTSFDTCHYIGVAFCF